MTGPAMVWLPVPKFGKRPKIPHSDDHALCSHPQNFKTFKCLWYVCQILFEWFHFSVKSNDPCTFISSPSLVIWSNLPEVVTTKNVLFLLWKTLWSGLQIFLLKLIHVQLLSPLTVGLTTKLGQANNYDKLDFIRLYYERHYDQGCKYSF